MFTIHLEEVVYFLGTIILNTLARQWCDKVNADVHSTTEERPSARLPQETLRELPAIPYYEENTIHVQIRIIQ